MIRSILSIMIVLFGTWIGMVLPGPTVGFVLLCALSGMCTGLALDKHFSARAGAAGRA